jgi:hypothetical protein
MSCGLAVRPRFVQHLTPVTHSTSHVIRVIRGAVYATHITAVAADVLQPVLRVLPP